MGRSPHRTRPERDRHDDNDDGDDIYPPLAKKAKAMGARSGKEVLTLSQRLLKPVVPLGHEYTDDEEKKEVFTALVRLKAAKLTNRECAEKLGVSERTINNYRADALYSEIEQQLEMESKQAGYTTIAEVIPDALSRVYEIMMTGQSEFVSFKAAELLLNYAGYGIPRETVQQNNREEVQKFLDALATRSRSAPMPNVQVNVQVNQQHDGTTVSSVQVETVEGSLVEQAIPTLPPASETPDPLLQKQKHRVPEDVPEELRQYYQPLQQGGKLPEGFA